MRFVIAVCYLTVTLPLMASCVAHAPGESHGPLRAFLDEDWKYWMARYPEAATAFGFPGQNARWTDYSDGAIASRAEHLRQSVDRLKAINPPGLEPSDQLDYDLYLEMLQAAVKGLDFGNDAMPVRSVIPHNLYMPINQLEGILQDIPRTIAMMPAASVADYEDIIKRLSGVADLVTQTTALMKQGVAKQLTPPRVTLRDVPDQAAAQVVTDPMTSPLLAAFRAFPPSIAEADRTRLTAAAVKAYGEHVGPIFKNLREFLVKEYLPACRETIERRRDAQRRGDVRSTTSAGTRRRTRRPRRSTRSVRPRSSASAPRWTP